MTQPTRRQIEVAEAVMRHAGNVSAAARELGIKPTTAHAMMIRHRHNLRTAARGVQRWVTAACQVERCRSSVDLGDVPIRVAIPRLRRYGWSVTRCPRHRRRYVRKPT